MAKCRWLVAPALIAAALSLAAAQPDADDKINPRLMDALLESEDGTAPFFVVFGQRAAVGAASDIADWAARGRFVVDRLQATAARSQNGVRGYLQGRKIEHTPFWIENKIYIPKGTLELAREMARRSEVAAIIPEAASQVPRPAPAVIGVQAAGWNLNLIGAPQVWSAYGNTGAGIVVGSIDTGVQYTHPALARQYRGNLGGGSYSHPGNWYDATNQCGAPCDSAGHGTHTVGTMIGDDGAGTQIGVAPGAKWIACRACSSTECSTSALISCAQWMLAPGGDPARRPNVVNNSWVGPGGDGWYDSYVQNWVAAGIFPAFAGGNYGPACGTAGSPGDYPAAFASGATDSGDYIASFSSRGPSTFGGVKPDVTAPGVSIYSSYPTNSYAFMSGTSMASPHTAAAVALLWAIRPDYKGNVAATQSLLKGNAAVRTSSESCGGVPAGASPNNTFGSGRIDVKRSVDAAGVPVQKAPVITITKPAADGEQFMCGTPVTFAGTASDQEDGNLSAAIQWSGPGTPANGMGASITKTFPCTQAGIQTIAASVTDSGGLRATDTVAVNILNAAKPAAPSNLTAAVSGSTVVLVWTDNAVNETGFKVYRRQKVGSRWRAWSLIKTIAMSNQTSYTDGAAGSGRYEYYVTAYNSSGQSAPSNSVIVNK